MSDHSNDLFFESPETAADDVARALLDQLLENSRLYGSSKDYQDLLDFTVRIRNFAPFNAMLLQIQKPGLSYAASAFDWRERFGRRPKEGARPLLILWPFGPVALVYDVLDTEGESLPSDVDMFPATGDVDEERVEKFKRKIKRKNIEWVWLDAGDGQAGSIRIIKRAKNDKEKSLYRMQINRNHAPAVQFTTLTHELGHLFLGHLGENTRLNIPKRPRLSHDQQEIEAESVAYLVCLRHGVRPKSETYLSRYVEKNAVLENTDLYQVMRAAGQVESCLGLTQHTKFAPPKKRLR